MYNALEGVRVVDISRLIPGAGVTHYLADLGAYVVKVEEPPVGDYLRDVKPQIEGLSLQELTLDRNKRSIALDLRTAEGRAVLHHMVSEADIAVTVSDPTALARRGADHETLRAVNKQLVVASFTGFGATSKYASVPTHGSNLACFAGVHGYEEREDGVIVPAALPYGRYRIPMEQASLYGAFAVLAALRQRDRTGEGVFLDLSITHTLMSADYASMVDRVNNGVSYMVDLPQPTPRYALYRTGDGRVILVCPIEKRFWEAFCNVLERPDLLARGDWSGNEMDFAPGDVELYRDVQRSLLTRTQSDWIERLAAARVPCSPAYSIEEAVEDPEIGGRIWVDGIHPRTGHGLRYMAPPILGLDEPFTARPAPSLGQDTAEVLEHFQVPVDAIAAAQAQGSLR